MELPKTSGGKSFMASRNEGGQLNTAALSVTESQNLSLPLLADVCKERETRMALNGLP